MNKELELVDGKIKYECGHKVEARIPKKEVLTLDGERTIGARGKCPQCRGDLY